MATYVLSSLNIFTRIPFDPYTDVLDLSASGVTAAQILFAGGDEDQGELSLVLGGRVVVIQLDPGQQLSESNFIGSADGGKVLLGDNSSAWRDDDLAQTINGTSGADLIAGFGGNDVINAGAGNDSIWSFIGEFPTTQGSDTINGGAGIDTLWLLDEDDSGQVTTLSANLATGVVSMGIQGTMQIANIENLNGGRLVDILTGDAGNNYLNGWEGNDTLSGGAGDDTLFGDTGNDSLIGGSGNDLLRGGKDLDTLAGGTGDDAYFYWRGDVILENPGEGTDTIRDAITIDMTSVANVENIELLGGAPVGATGNSLANLITGNGARNFMEGGGGNDTLNGGAGEDVATYNTAQSGVVVTFSSPGSGTVSDGLGGTDTLINIERAYGGAFNDSITGSSGDEWLRGNAGNDTLNGGGGFDTDNYFNSTSQVRVNLSGTPTTVNGTLLAAASAADGFSGTDTLSNLEGVVGGSAGDIIVGSSGNNRLEAYAGTDTLIGGAGNDTLDGYISSIAFGSVNGISALVADGNGDEVRYTDAQQGVNVSFATGTAVDGIDADTLTGGMQAGTDVLISIESVFGSPFDDTLVGGNPNHVLQGLFLSDPFEMFEGGAGADVIDGGDHNGAGSDNGYFDRVSYRSDAAGVIVNLGSDDLVVGSETIAGGHGRDGSLAIDTLANIDGVWGSGFADYLRGGSSSVNLQGTLFEVFAGLAGNDTIDGEGGIDRVEYNFSGVGPVNVQIDASTGLGTASNDGQGGVDTLFDIEGVRGSDSATGDTLTGGAGDEFFEGRAGPDTINGAGGNDTAQYLGSPAGALVNLSEITVLGLSANTASDGFGSTDTLINIEHATGGDFSDTFVGQPGQNNTLDGRGGARLTGQSIGFNSDAADYTGHFAIDADLSTGIVDDGSGGIDTLIGIERVNGGAGDDTLLGADTSLEYTGLFTDRIEFFRGGAGLDSIDGGTDAWGDHTNVDYSSSVQGVLVSLGDGVALDGLDFDTISPGMQQGADELANIDGVIGSAFNDTLFGGSDSRNFGGTLLEIFSPGGGNDTIYGESDPFSGNDRGFDILSYQGATGSGILANLSWDPVVLNGVTVQSRTVNATGVGQGIDSFPFGIDGIRGSQGNDNIVGGGSNNLNREIYELNAGNDFLDGGEELDITSYRTSPTSVYVHLGYGFALDGWGFTDTFTNVEGASGGDFDDTLIGGSNHQQDQGDVDWEEFEGRAGNDYIDGNDGFDIGIVGPVDLDLDAAAYRNAPGAVNANMVTGVALDGYGTTDTLVDVEVLYGSRFDDTLTGGNAAHDRFEGFEGRAGNDLITGGSGSDFVLYEESPGGVIVNLGATPITVGAVTVQPGTARDGWILPGDTDPGVDTLSGIENAGGGRGDDLIVGSAGANLLFADDGNDTLIGGAGDDELQGSDWNGGSVADYSPATTGVVVNLAIGRASDGQGGTDRLSFIDGVFGGDFDDLFVGDDSDNFFMGRAGDDTLQGGGGDDFAVYFESPAAVSVDLGAGTAADGYGNTDVLISIEGVAGSAFNDTLNGSSGDNFFYGEAGDDSISGGAGLDTALYDDAGGAVTITGGGSAFAGAYTVTGAAGTDTLSGVESVVGSEFADLINGRVLGAGEREFLQGNGGDDTIRGGSTGLTVMSFFEEQGSVFINLGAAGGNGSGIDGTFGFNDRTITYRNIEGVIGGNWNDSVTGSSSGDFFEGGYGGDTFSGGGGIDTVSFAHSSDPAVVNLGGGSQTLTYFDADGESKGTFTIAGGQALDGVFQHPSGGSDQFWTDVLSSVEVVEGSNFNDTMFGASGVGERFEGGAGDDAFSGGGGVANDTFSGGAGVDRVNFSGTTQGVGVVVDLAAGTANKGANGVDTLISIESVSGTTFNDTLRGSDSIAYTGRMTDGFEFFFGGAGDDVIDGADTIGGSPDGQFDIVSYDAFSGISSGVTVNLGTGTASGSGGNDTLSNIDMVVGSSFADSLTGGSQSSGLFGTFFEQFRGNAGNDTIDGSFGEDRVDYSFATGPVNVVLGNGGSPGSANDGQGGTDVLINVENVRGSSYSDILTGGGTQNAGNLYDFESFEGQEGNDTINGLGGFDQAAYSRSPSAVNVDLATGFGFDGFGTRDVLSNVEGVIGSDFDDTLTGSGNTASIEQFRGGAGNDTIDGAGGADRAAYHASPGAVVVNLATGVAQDGYGTTDTLLNIEAVRGSIFNDTLIGGSGGDTLEGYSGNDSIDGGAGTDWASYERNQAGVNVNLGTGTATSSWSGDDTLVSIEAVLGSSNNDSMTGSDSADIFAGVEGDDSMSGAGGDDTFSMVTLGTGISGADTIDGGLGSDWLVFDPAVVVGNIHADFSAGTVTVSGTGASLTVTSIENLRAGGGDDHLEGGASDVNFFYGGAGNDTLLGGLGSDTALYDVATSGVVVNLNLNTASDGLGGTDFLNSIENVIGSAHDDVIRGKAFGNRLEGGAGADTLDGFTGDDTLDGGGAPVVSDGVSYDVADYSNNDVGEQINANLGTGFVSDGTGGTDTLINIRGVRGTNFADTLTGGSGDDVLEGRGGIDIIDGGAGNDAVAYTTSQIGVSISLQSSSFGGDNVSNVENIFGSAFNDSLTGDGGNNLLFGDAGNDSLGGGSAGGNDTLLGGAGNDTLGQHVGGAGIDRMVGGTGDDVYLVDNVLDVIVELDGEGFDTLQIHSVDYAIPDNIESVVYFGAGNDSIAGNAANNVIAVSGTNMTLSGGAGNDTLTGDGGDSIVGGADIDTVTFDLLNSIQVNLATGTTSANDTLVGIENAQGGNQSDTLIGNAGANVLNGLDGADSMQGGSGADIYYVNNAGDVVTETDNTPIGIGGPRQEIDLGSIIDRVIASITYTLGQFLEDLELAAGAGNVNGTGNELDNILTGNEGNNVLDGLAGNDTASFANALFAVSASLISGAATGYGNDTLVNIENLAGSAFNDTLTGTSGNNSISGGAGADLLDGGAGNDTLDGGGGVDTATYAAAGGAVGLSIAAGQATGALGADVLIGIENLIAGVFNDTLAGDAGDNLLDGGGGIDLVSYLDAIGAITVNLAGTQATGAGNDTLLGIENLIGGKFNDLLTGDANDNVIEGWTGNDALDGGGGNDTGSYAGAGAAITARLALAGPQSTGGAGIDSFVSIENLLGSAFDDRLGGDGGANRIDGGLGNDTATYEDAAGGVAVSLANAGAQATGGAGNDTVVGFENLVGSGFNDTLGGEGGANLLEGAAGNDSLTGAAGNDTLDGGGGSDTMVGGAGDDSFVVDVAGDVCSEALNEGMDTVSTSVDYDIQNNIENITLLGVGNIRGGGNSANNAILGNSGANFLQGRAGNDTLSGADGDDNLDGGAGDDLLDAGAGTDTASYSVAAGAVTLSLAVAGAQITGGAGSDTLVSIENLTGSAFNDSLTGDGNNNALNGAAGNDTLGGGVGDDALDGGTGADVMSGGTGNDAYWVDNALDVCSEAGAAGTDTVKNSVDYDIGNNIENVALLGGGNIRGGGNSLDNVLTGNNGANLLQGRAGNDTIDGGAGVDNMAGGTGNDTYFVDATNDLCSEAVGEGTDVVFSTVGYNINNNIETLTLLGVANIQGGGNASDNTILGNSGNNFLQGRGGNDVLDGGAGADIMVGGTGNDTMYVNQTNDVASESLNEGTDTVYSLANYDIQNNIENLILQGGANLRGGGNTLDNTILGNSGNNFLQGRVGNDTIDGGGGSDNMVGGAGNDTYFVNQTSDICTEALNEGTDTVFSLANYDLNNNVENLTLQGSDNLNGGGNTLANTINGNSGANLLQGRAGADTLAGGAGADTLNGGAGADKFVFADVSNDTIQDFELAVDDIVLDNAFFTQLGPDGALDAAKFYSAAGASQGLDGDDYLVYDQASGALYYDADGAGGASGLQLATLVGSPDALTHSDFIVG